VTIDIKTALPERRGLNATGNTLYGRLIHKN
jgi:hypothetical protein